MIKYKKILTIFLVSCPFASLYSKWPSAQPPVVHMVLGSGYSQAFDLFEKNFKNDLWKPVGRLSFSEVPSIQVATAPGHKSEFRYYQETISGKVICFQMGRLHGYEGLTPRQAVEPVFQAFLKGTKNFVLMNAAGGICEKHQVGDIMIIRDHLNLTGRTPLEGELLSHEGKNLGPRFSDMSFAYDESLSDALESVLQTKNIGLHEGIYAGLLGPSFETPAEIRYLKTIGADVVGMSTVWENILLNNLGAKVCGLSLISNAAAGMTGGKPLTHEDVLEACEKTGASIIESLFDFASKHKFINVKN